MLKIVKVFIKNHINQIYQSSDKKIKSINQQITNSTIKKIVPLHLKIFRLVKSIKNKKVCT